MKKESQSVRIIRRVLKELDLQDVCDVCKEEIKWTNATMRLIDRGLDGFCFMGVCKCAEEKYAYWSGSKRELEELGK